MKFYGRLPEIEALQAELRLSLTHSRLAVITGRRRVGKTKLILKVAADSGRPMLYFLCRRKYGHQELAQVWMDEIRSVFDLDEDAGPRRLTLANVVKFVMKLSQSKPCILILDECQEIDYVAPTFWADLQGVWDLEREQSKLLLVMSGSIAAAIRHIFDDASEPLFGRQDLSLTLHPFSPAILREIFLDFNPKGSADDLLTYYAVTGGVAWYAAYLAETVPLTREAIIGHVFSERGQFLRTDGATLLANEFRTESAIYERILREIAAGATKWNEICDRLQEPNIAGYMDRLVRQYGLIRKVSPLFSSSKRGVRYAISDPYFRFWFRFVEPAQSQTLAARGNWAALQALCLEALDQFTGRTLEDWFQAIYGGDPGWTLTGCWWDRRGENEIDLIAINELTNRMQICEIKRNPKKLDMSVLAMKAAALQQNCGSAVAKYGPPELKGLSLADMLPDRSAS